MKFCKYCGTQLANTANCACSGAQAAAKRTKKAAIYSCVAIVVLLAIILVVPVIENAAKIDPSQYLEVTFDGYDGRGEPIVSFDFDSLIAKLIGDVPEDDIEAYYEWLALAAAHEKNIQLDYPDIQDLSNGDSIVVNITVSGETAQKVKNTATTFVVSGLTALESIDVFSEYAITFSGVSGDGKLSFDTDSTDFCLGVCRFSYEPKNNLSNGDIVTVTITNEDYLIETFQKQPKELTKTYVVSGLDTYITGIDQIPVDELSALAYEWLATVESKTTADGINTYNNFAIQGCYLAPQSRTGSTGYCILIVVSFDHCVDIFGDCDSEYKTLTFVRPVLHTDGSLGLTVSDGNISYNSGTYSPDEGTIEIVLPQTAF